MATPSLRALEKAVELLGQIVECGEIRSISSLAGQIEMPRSTAYRIAATFERSGFLTRLRRGHYLPGPALLRLGRRDNLQRVLKGLGRPVVDKLSRDTGCIAHLGVFEDGMVTYLLKAGRLAGTVFTREGTQLEAYCTGIGKVLLAALPDTAREEYLRTGPFIRLTQNTLTDPQVLRSALQIIAAQGFATDNAEMDVDLLCLAVPVRVGNGEVVAALSISTRVNRNPGSSPLAHLETLRRAANVLRHRLEPGYPV
jgi:IclR family transcriptional regulator, acetate operon repressor